VTMVLVTSSDICASRLEWKLFRQSKCLFCSKNKKKSRLAGPPPVYTTGASCVCAASQPIQILSSRRGAAPSGEATRTARVARSSRPAPEKKASERGGVIGGGRMWAGGHGAALLPAGPAQHPPSPAPPPQAGTHHAPARFPSRPSVHPSVEQAELRNPN
jgi:hypothetical protein